MTDALAALVRDIVTETVEQLAANRQPTPETYTTSELAVVLNVSPDHVGKLCREGVIPTLPRELGSKLLIPRRWVDELLDAASTPSARPLLSLAPSVASSSAPDADGVGGVAGRQTVGAVTAASG